VNMILFNFNILPIPPLDGFGVLESLAPPSLAPLVASLRSIGWMVLLVLIISGVVSYLFLPGVWFRAAINHGRRNRDRLVLRGKEKDGPRQECDLARCHQEGVLPV